MSDDHLLPAIEDILKARKKAYPRQVTQNRSFAPLSAVELGVPLPDSREELRLTEWEDREGKLYIDLRHKSSFVRKGHFNHTWHTNPNKQAIPPPHHIHFPTANYPLKEHFYMYQKEHTYAYQVQSENDCVNALLKFCLDTNIDIQGIWFPLLRRYQ